MLFVLRGISFRVLHRWAEKTESRIDDIIIRSLKTPSIYWCVAIGLYIGIAISDVSEKYVFYLTKIIHVIVIFSITIASANLAGKLFRDYIKKSSLPIPTTGLAYGILKGTILVIGFNNTYCPRHLNNPSYHSARCRRSCGCACFAGYAVKLILWNSYPRRKVYKSRRFYQA